MTLAARTDISGFVIQACIAENARSSVYRARRARDRVALKVYRPEPSAVGSAKRVARECDAQMRIAHPAVARLIDAGSLSDGSIWLASEWIEGVSLEEQLQRETLAWPQLHSIARAVASGLGAIHAAGIVHRDIKPSNIILPQAGEEAAMLIDFGCSLLLSEERLTDRGLALGSASYMAPEQADGQALDGRADLYALGVVLYRALCGTLPFVHASPAEVLRQHQLEPVVPPRRRAPERAIPAAAEDLCLWLLAKEPAARLPNAHVLGVTLAAIDPGAPRRA